MNQIYIPAIKNTQTHIQNELSYFDANISSIEISQSYKHLLYNRALGIQNLSFTQNYNSKLRTKKTNNNRNINIAQQILLSELNPNLGNLQQFMSNKMDQKRLVYTSKKKRHQQSSQQNEIKRKIAQRNIQDSILFSPVSSNFQKKLASRVLVQKMFEQVYKRPVQEFINQNNKRDPYQSSRRINLITLQNLLLKPDLKQTKCISDKRNEQKLLVFGIDTQKDRKYEREVQVSFDKLTKLNMMIQMKSRYNDLKKTQIPRENQHFHMLIQAQNELDNYLKQMAYNIDFASRNSRLLTQTRNSVLISKSIMITQPVNIQKRMGQVSQKFRRQNLKSVIHPDTVAKVTQHQVIFTRMEFRDIHMGLYMINYLDFQKIRIIRLQNIAIEKSLLFLFIDVLSKFTPKTHPLKQLSICALSIQNTSKFSQKIAQLLKQRNLKKLCLNYVDLGNRQFSKICVGIAQNQFLQQIQMKNNHINCLAVKSLQSLMKISHNIKYIDLRNNQIQSLKNSKNRDPRILI